MRGVLPREGRRLRAVHGELEWGKVGGWRKNETKKNVNQKKTALGAHTTLGRKEGRFIPCPLRSRPLTFFRFCIFEHTWLVRRRLCLDVVFPQRLRPWPRSLSSSSTPILQRCSSTQRPRRSRRRRSPKTLLLLRQQEQQLPLPPLPLLRPRGARPLTARVSNARGEFVGLKNGRWRKRESRSVAFTNSRPASSLCFLFCDLPPTLFLVLTHSPPDTTPSLCSLSLSSLFRQQQQLETTKKPTKSFNILEGGTPQFEVREYAPAPRSRPGRAGTSCARGGSTATSTTSRAPAWR